VSTVTRVSASDGIPLLVRTWETPGLPRRAEVVIVHGLGEHSGRYQHVGDHLAATGLQAMAFDLRGHGGSGGARAFVGRFGDYLDDLGTVIAVAARKGLPVVLYGHSLGGLIALRYSLDPDRAVPDLLVLSAPALDAAIIPSWKRAVAPVLGRLLPRLTLPNDIAGDHLSRDPSVGTAYFDDPLVLVKTTTRLGSEMLRAMGEVRMLMAHLRIPTLVIHGGEDVLVPTATSEVLASLACVERVVLSGLRHEVHNEDSGARALAVIDEWIDRHLDPAAS
jgi:alpha-beta hydrolase superfamily lysophospholipase